MLKVFNLKFYIKLLQMLFCLFLVIMIMQFDVIYIRAKNRIASLEKENGKMRDDILTAGGLGLDVSEYERMDINKLVGIYQQRHSLASYKWKYSEIGYPLNPQTTYITCEYGNRMINGQWECAKSIDMKQADSLEVRASIDGFARVSKHSVYGYNILIENLVVMKNELNQPEIMKVKIRVSHLSKIYVNDGQWIKKSDIIGLTGNSGRCCIFDARLMQWREITEHERNLGLGLHLDFELSINGYLRNPFANSTFGKQVKL